jgi:hypothetical protein
VCTQHVDDRRDDRQQTASRVEVGGHRRRSGNPPEDGQGP